ncbi:hypothetical protein BGZ83_005464 [Gryganskiella cystojenkinii]|nr:hypothetical protein BGZ83_005464 [Gryganskiella cystojenkinii]
MSTLIRSTAAAAKTASTHRFISTSMPRNAAVAIEQHTATVASTAPSRSIKTVAYTVTGTAVVAGGAHLLFKDEVVYWTPNTRK